MRKITLLVMAGSATLMLSGCGSSGLFNRVRPDEFAVQRQAPLVVPPDFALTPPQPGAPRPSAHTAQAEALDALFGGPAARSDVEKSAVGRAGTPETSIRSTVADPPEVFGWEKTECSDGPHCPSVATSVSRADGDRKSVV